MTWYKCSSCGGVYEGENYYHVCPPGTAFARDENIDDSTWNPITGKDSRKPRKQKKGKKRHQGGANKIPAPSEVDPL